MKYAIKLLPLIAVTLLLLITPVTTNAQFPPMPTTGVLIVTTTPMEGEIFIDGECVGTGYYRNDAMEPGVHTIACGPLEGYIPPETVVTTVVATETKTIVMEYTPQGADWKKWLKWGAIVLAIGFALGLAVGIGIGAVAKPKAQGSKS